MAFTRISSDMTRYGHKRIYSSTFETLMKIGYFDVNRKNPINIFPILNYYKGFSLSLICSVTYYSTLLFTFKMNNLAQNHENGFVKKYLSLFGPSIFGGVCASIISYPFDTVKRQIQVNGSLGFNKIYFSVTHAFKMNYESGIKSFYKYGK